jgi:hypothetical protein
MVDMDYYVLTLAAVARELKIIKTYSADVYIAAGLPLTWVSEQRADFKKYLLQNETADFIFKGKAYHVRRITRVTELTPELVHEFIEKVIVSKPDNRDGERYQTVDIYYNGVGIIREPSPEEMERYFNEHMTRSTRKTA